MLALALGLSVLLLPLFLLVGNPQKDAIAAEPAVRAANNLLRNASFLQSTNRPIPDYWDLHHAAALAFRNLHQQYSISETEHSPVPGTKVLIVDNNERNFPHAILTPQLLSGKLPAGSYTFSVYAKSVRGPAELLIYQAWGEPKVPTKKLLSGRWERYSVTFSVGRFDTNPPQPMLYLPSNAGYRIAAPQLEFGTSASDFHPCREDSGPSVFPGKAELRANGASSINSNLSKARRRGGEERTAGNRYLEIDQAPFFMIGMEVGAPDNLPDWYLDDLAAHGINTLFIGARKTAQGDFDLLALQRLLAKAGKHRFKVVVGRPLMGNKDPDWRRHVSALQKLVQALKSEANLIAWESVDEPAANTWTDSELLEIYRGVKQIDPSRPVFMNWAYDGVPAEIGAEPRGTLRATDIYSMDYYPYAGEGRSMDDFTGYSVKVLETARIFNKIPHSWIQLYGGMDAWREPSGAELNYMVYLNLLYGGTFSYWNTKSNSATTWNRVAEINRQAQTLARELFLNPRCSQLRLPEFKGNFSFSVWDNGKALYLIALHNGRGTENFELDLSGMVRSQGILVRSLFEQRKVALAGKWIKESFVPYQSRVYVVAPDR